MPSLDNISDQFPLLNRLAPCGTPLIYLDSAATALKPQCVIDAVSSMLINHTANIHRSVHFLGDEATEAYESVRDIVAYFLNAEPNEVVFVRNATEALNIVSNCFDMKGNRVVSSTAEHHSNYLPWSDDVYRLGVDVFGQINLDELQCQLAQRDVALVSLSHVSNVTGNILDIKEVIRISHYYGAKVLIDAAQSAAHIPIDVTELDCDFLVFSGHKLGSPTGVGVLYGKAQLLAEMDLFLKGGSTIEEVTTAGFVVKNAPWKFEAGTPAIESVVGLGAAVNFLLEIGMENIQRKFKQLSSFTENEIQLKIPEAVILGASQGRSFGPYSFNVPGMSSHLLARGLSDRFGICVRSGFHCAQPLHQQLNATPSLRISFWIYNNETEISKTIEGIATLLDVAKR